MKPSQKVEELPGVGPVGAAAFKRLGVRTVGDLLRYLPSRLEDRSQLGLISELPVGEDTVIGVTVEKVSTRRSQRGVQIIQAKVRDDSGTIDCLWFNQLYLLRYLRPGQRYYLFGQKRLAPSLHNPFFVKKIIDRPEICPIYPTVQGLTQAAWRKLERAAVPALTQLTDIVPSPVSQQEKLPPLAETLARAHAPETLEDLPIAQHRLGFEELLLLALSTAEQKRRRRSLKAVKISTDNAFITSFAARLPFTLTAGQRAAIGQVLTDAASGAPMRRLLYGEVGSGKTAVAAAVIAAFLRAGQRVIVLAPTTALAAQQTDRLRQFLPDYRVALFTGQTKTTNSAAADCVVATHAAFYTNQLGNFGLIIIDEQQRFGVDQRQQLLNAAAERHVLMMTATPIPRSLAQTVFGAVDITHLTGKPAHQQAVTTRRFKATDRPEIETAIAERLNRGEPGYVICGLIDEQAEPVDLLALERKTVMGEARRLMKRFPQATVGVLHGRLDETDKQKIIGRFRSGQVTILIATTVVEVGIDNPLASWMLVEDADRFGLSQLHQLRGRVGRGERASVCFLVDGGTSPLGSERLRLVEEITDGLTLSEHDLRLRGPGELVGQTQSGLPALKYADWSDTERLRRIFAIAEKLLDDGLDRYPPLKRALQKYGRGQTETII